MEQTWNYELLEFWMSKNIERASVNILVDVVYTYQFIWKIFIATIWWCENLPVLGFRAHDQRSISTNFDNSRGMKEGPDIYVLSLISKGLRWSKTWTFINKSSVYLFSEYTNTRNEIDLNNITKLGCKNYRLDVMMLCFLPTLIFSFDSMMIRYSIEQFKGDPTMNSPLNIGWPLCFVPGKTIRRR